MRQVPASSQRARAHYLVIGDGRLARHLVHYLKLENLSFDQWSRHQDPLSLRVRIERASHVLLAVSDAAIEPFFKARPDLQNRVCVHFSGALSSSLLASAHPLMTFGPELYSLDEYRAIPFVTERGRATFGELLPDLRNPSFEIASAEKPLYHALCAISGNFTVLLWESVRARFAGLGLPGEILFPYLARTTANLISAPPRESVLTGPLARGDFGTIEKHLEALRGDPLADVYRAFVQADLTASSCSEPTPFPFGGLA